MEFVCDNVSILEASSRLMESVVVECWLVVQQRCKYVILAPLQLYTTFLKVRRTGTKVYLFRKSATYTLRD